MEREHIPLLPENDVEEGAKLFRLLENSAEPELLMADMSATQHAAFTAYQAKREVKYFDKPTFYFLLGHLVLVSIKKCM